MFFAGCDIDLHDVAIGVIVGRVPGRVARRIVGERRDAIEHRAFDVGEMPDVAATGVKHAEVTDDARIAEGADKIAGARIDEGA